MKKYIISSSNSKSEYWESITSTLSSYEVKVISSDGKVEKTLVKDDYFLVKDTWNASEIGEIPNFSEQLNAYRKYKNQTQNIKYTTKNPNIGLELKYIFYHKLFADEISLTTLFRKSSINLHRLIKFLNEKHPYLNSLLDLDVDKTETEWTWWLNNNGIKTVRTKKDDRKPEYHTKSKAVNFFRSIHKTLFKLTDTREEWEKDKWDVRVLKSRYGVDYNLSTEIHHLNFSTINNPIFKQYLKKYIKYRLLGGRNYTFSTALVYVSYVPRFLNYINELEPNWNDFNNLARKHIEKYLEYLNEYAKNHLNRSRSTLKQYISKNLNCVYTFLTDIQRYDYIIAPNKPVANLLYPEDYPSLEKKSGDNIDYIPDYILDQLFEHIKDLHPDVQPVVWVAFKSGLRISDVLGLTQNCLISLNGKYSIQTDIKKTYVKGHKIPIDDQLANMLAVLIHSSKQYSNEDNNPDRYIFVRYKGARKGKPFSQAWVREKLNELAFKKNITDEMGNIFHFKTHQFRHTYAVKLLNNGADILTVQDLLAHSSPEMTIRYARLLEDTKRKVFEKVVSKGVFTFDLNGEINNVSENEDIPADILEMLWQDEKLNALDNPYGTCRARVNGNCPLAAEPPCLTANDGKPCFDLAVGMNSFDIKKYELLIETTSKWIEASKEYGREDMVESNEKNLERYQNIYNTIKNGNIIFGRFERFKKQMDRTKKKGVTNG